METSEIEKSKIFNIMAMDCFVENGVFIKTILQRPTGIVSAIFMDRGEQISENFSRFANFIQIIEGKADIQIDEKSFQLNSGESLIIPANSKNTIRANERFKMISTIIKSGYE